MNIDIKSNVQFHDQLYPRVWTNAKMDPRVRYHLLRVAKQFIESLDLENLPLRDVQLTGSLASYNYTSYSDFDVHVVVDRSKISCEPDVADELFQAKKSIWNKTYPVVIYGHDVELYVEDSASPPTSNGTYSLIDGVWVDPPKKQRPNIDHSAVLAKTLDLARRITDAVENKDYEDARDIKDKIGRMRKSSIAKEGLYGVENLAFKVLRNQGYLDNLRNFITQGSVEQLSLREKNANNR
jgi:predicted nucleotidyltransferase